MTGPDGKRGTNWTLPYRVSKLMHQQDNNKKLCSLYDVVFSTDVMKFLVHADFKKFVADTAIDGVGRVLT